MRRLVRTVLRPQSASVTLSGRFRRARERPLIPWLRLAPVGLCGEKSDVLRQLPQFLPARSQFIDILISLLETQFQMTEAGSKSRSTASCFRTGFMESRDRICRRPSGTHPFRVPNPDERFFGRSSSETIIDKVGYGPKWSRRSRHGAPGRKTQKMPLRTRTIVHLRKPPRRAAAIGLFWRCPLWSPAKI